MWGSRDLLRPLGPVIDATLARSPLQWWFWRQRRARLAVLAYHGVSDADRFEAQVREIVRRMRPVTCAEAVRVGFDGMRLPPRAVLITFDDGDPSVLDNGIPVLRQYGVPAILFVIPGLIGTDRPFWWEEAMELVRRGARSALVPCGTPADCVRGLKRLPDDERRRALDELRRTGGGDAIRARQLTVEEIRSLESEGFEIGNHTLTHPCLDRCTDDRLDEEITRAHEMLSGWLGREPRAFAFPNGNSDPRADPVLARLGYEAAFLFDHRLVDAAPPSPFRVSRVRINSHDSIHRFRAIASGLHPYIHRRIGRT